MAILGKTSSRDYQDLKDFKHVDESVHSSLKFILENDLSQYADSIDINFTMTLDTSGHEIELKEYGALIKVDNQNKAEFAKLKCHYIGYIQNKPQLEKIREGFYQVIPMEWIRFLTVDELETWLCGKDAIDLNDWRTNTEYRGFFLGDKSVTVYRFWYAMGTYT